VRVIDSERLFLSGHHGGQVGQRDVDKLIRDGLTGLDSLADDGSDDNR
jgi:hypothetical protein